PADQAHAPDNRRHQTQGARRQQDIRGRPALRRGAAQDARLLAGSELPSRWPDLPDGQSATEGAIATQAHQAAPARPPGNHVGPELPRCSPDYREQGPSPRGQDGRGSLTGRTPPGRLIDAAPEADAPTGLRQQPCCLAPQGGPAALARRRVVNGFDQCLWASYGAFSKAATSAQRRCHSLRSSSANFVSSS